MPITLHSLMERVTHKDLKAIIAPKPTRVIAAGSLIRI